MQPDTGEGLRKPPLRIGIAVSSFNAVITDGLLAWSPDGIGRISR